MTLQLQMLGQSSNVLSYAYLKLPPSSYLRLRDPTIQMQFLLHVLHWTLRMTLSFKMSPLAFQASRQSTALPAVGEHSLWLIRSSLSNSEQQHIAGVSTEPGKAHFIPELTPTQQLTHDTQKVNEPLKQQTVSVLINKLHILYSPPLGPQGSNRLKPHKKQPAHWGLARSSDQMSFALTSQHHYIKFHEVSDAVHFVG